MADISKIQLPGSTTQYNIKDAGAARTSHTHGNITSDGKGSGSAVLMGAGDALLFTDSDNSGTITRSYTFSDKYDEMALYRDGQFKKIANDNGRNYILNSRLNPIEAVTSADSAIYNGMVVTKWSADSNKYPRVYKRNMVEDFVLDFDSYYTVSFYCKVENKGNESTSAMVYVTLTPALGNNFPKIINNVTSGVTENAITVSFGRPTDSDWHRYSATFKTPPRGDSTNAYWDDLTDIRFRVIANVDTWIGGVKLEKGMQPSDWTPAPEDEEIYENILTNSLTYKQGLLNTSSFLPDPANTEKDTRVYIEQFLKGPFTVTCDSPVKIRGVYPFTENGKIKQGSYTAVENATYSVGAGEIVKLLFYDSTSEATATTPEFIKSKVHFSTVGSHTHGWLQNNGTAEGSYFATNRLMWVDDAKAVHGGNHFASATKIAINSTSEPSSYNFLVSGSSLISGSLYVSTNAKNGGADGKYGVAIVPSADAAVIIDGNTGANAAGFFLRENYASNANNLGGLFINKRGTASQDGTIVVLAGNSVSSGSNYNYNGILRLFNKNGCYHDIRPENSTASGSKEHLLPSTAGYLVASPTTGAGSVNRPVYVSDKGVATTAVGVFSGTELPTSGTYYNGDVFLVY